MHYFFIFLFQFSVLIVGLNTTVNAQRSTDKNYLDSLSRARELDLPQTNKRFQPTWRDRRAEEGLTGFTKTPQGVYIKFENEGGAQKPNAGSTVTIHYRGKLTNGKQFDSSFDRGAPSSFPLTGLIQGWQVGIPYFGKGGKGTLIIPPTLGYGSRGQGDIPGNAILVFDIELINFQ